MVSKFFSLAVAGIALAIGTVPAAAQTTNLEASFDSMLGTEVRAPRSFEAVYDTDFARRIAQLANASDGRIGVAAVDLSTGEQISVLGEQRFPMASTSKIAIACTFLEGVEQGKWTLNSEFPMLYPVSSGKYSSARAPVREGKAMPAIDLIEQMITRSNNYATDGLLRAVGGPEAVNAWVRRNGIREFNLTRDIATLVRDDGEFDPAYQIDARDSATPLAMIDLLTGLQQGRFLSDKSRKVLLGAMSRTRTGTRRIPKLIPSSAQVLHKTGSLNNTSSDVGIIRMPDGRAFALAIYVTGQGSRSAREAKIASIARALYDGYAARSPATHYTAATYGGH
ncbi:class A beta-lactamase-related serine hydrolase [Erythrobacter sp. LQ02-29]|uniref:serine hydrolase n=1 Tax=Erythrobacter sp. LQ02-29 TaxID=2920384 RepID=UPI001F4DA628|nr:serine hydrolase [Erythrobacter sp. LQ02-29]MCP9221526.1 class A beta-lactamase-related serine hydrolase [Erythrobacter sp. LQ02-29]